MRLALKGRTNSNGGQDDVRRSREKDEERSGSGEEKKKSQPKKRVEEEEEEDDDDIVVEDDGMAAMQAMMGFGGFGTTQNKQVAGNNVSAVRKEKKTEYRQYMNRVGGFNRPLSPNRNTGAQLLVFKLFQLFPSCNWGNMTPLYLRLPVAALVTVLLSWGTSVHAAEAQDVGILTTEIAREQNNSLLWGAYKPNLYFGVRPRIPKSFTGGLMWAKVDNFVDVQNNFRHTCELLWAAKPHLFSKLKEQIDEYIKTYGEENPPPPYQIYTISHAPDEGNFHLVQKVFQGDFEFDIIFNSASAEKGLTSQEISRLIAQNSKSFFERFIATFDLQPPFNIESLQRFSSHMFSNLIGGLGYFSGDSVVDRSYAEEYEESNEGFWEEAAEARARRQEKLEGPSELFTTVPSRPFFPRGFLWDEGFHLLPIADWDIDLTLEIVKSWFNLMDEDGWIGREQILGAEARSKVPAEFQTQYPHYANPPTLFFIVDAFISKLGALNGTSPLAKEKLAQESSIYSAYLQKPEAGLQYLNELYPKLKKHYYWFRKSQSGDLKSYDRDAFSTKEGYRWRGRTPQHILTSGLDDYPRPQPPHPGELHVDLISWMGMMTKSLKNIAGLLGMSDDVAELSTIETAIHRNIDDLHWSEKEKCYCDATIDDYEEHQLVCLS
ncbi:hypothetical protein DID88_003673 [Monilinia fructigena]|uniref:Mannosyl-oligosaccharide glucosidase n=1 Tax=Monilinia fructigena TaxID=38457 RepID=A0A395IZ67_9HELO|nr:hypothetical protein DID88_003673 [Monilinia fructigena]